MEEEGGGGGIIEEIVAAITSILAPSVYFAIFQRVWKYRLKCLPYQLVSLLVVRHTFQVSNEKKINSLTSQLIKKLINNDCEVS